MIQRLHQLFQVWIGTNEIPDNNLLNYNKSIQLLEDDNWNHHLLTDESETVKKIKNTLNTLNNYLEYLEQLP